MTGNFNIAIVGGGAAGLLTACRLVSLGIDKIAVIDGNKEMGRKINATGNGRCNLSNLVAEPEKYYCDDPAFLAKLFSKYDISQILTFIEKDLGIRLAYKDGLVYPATYKAETVTEALLDYCNDGGVKFVNNFKVTQCKHLYGRFMLNNDITATNLLVSAGGTASPKFGTDGSSYKIYESFAKPEDFAEPVPSLVQFKTLESDTRKLNGSRYDCSVSLVTANDTLATENGELMFTNYGVSGICAMNLSGKFGRYTKETGKDVYLSINFMPKCNVEEEVKFRLEKFTKRTPREALAGMLSADLLDVILARAQNDKDRIPEIIKNFRLKVMGTMGFDHAQVTSGGLKLSSINENMELKSTPGLFSAGEVINVDGPCGGFNLHWAWVSAFAAADGIAAAIKNG
ncbi:MAG: aminoacetone oxidase family FAD-binding enzyme [Clostridiales bacterium]|nr:aminoacetone oxidase family FAD-binding enzyme [Clostridiales bacterium]